MISKLYPVSSSDVELTRKRYNCVQKLRRSLLLTVDVCRTRPREGFGITVGLHEDGLLRGCSEFHAYTMYKGESKYRLSLLELTLMRWSYLVNQVLYSE